MKRLNKLRDIKGRSTAYKGWWFEMNAPSSFFIERVQKQSYGLWFKDFADWTHAVTVTCKPSHMGFDRSASSMISATTHFVHSLNRRVLGRSRVKQGHRIASIGVYGAGAYQDNPHVHLAFQAPHELSYMEMCAAIKQSIQSTKGLGFQEDIQHYTSEGWLTYILDHGTDGLLVELISPAKY
jgi:hypothetical protein